MSGKILIFGFEPYGRHKTNISKTIVNTIKNKSIGKKTIFPITFNKNRIIQKIKKSKPELIIGLAQHPRARKIRIERRAQNIIKRKKYKKSQLISKSSKKYLFANLKIDKTDETAITYDAGTYICNFVMFAIMDYILKNNKNIKFAFLHIPQNYNIKSAIGIINAVIYNIEK